MDKDKLRSIIRDRGLKQRWVADRLGVSYGLVNQWIKTAKPISERRLLALKELFD